MNSLRINWDEVSALKTRLMRSGATHNFELVIIVFYNTKAECDKIKVKLSQLERSLFDIGDNRDVSGVFLYDVQIRHPYWKCERMESNPASENIPSSGHSNVILEWNNMSRECRDVWFNITMQQLAQYMERTTSEK